jgi:hypothetical protein
MKNHRAKALLLAISVVGLLLIGVFNCTGQTFSEAQPFKTDLNIAIDIGETIDVEGTVFPVFETKSGANFVKCISAKSGNEYPVWIHEQTEHEYKGFIVHKSPKGKYCYYKLNKTGYPMAVWLSMN